MPVVGFAEAGPRAAAALPGHFLIATRGTLWRDLLADLTLHLGLADRIAGTLAFESADAKGACAEIADEATTTGAARVVGGGAGLIPMIPAIAAGLHLPLLDPHRAAIARAGTVVPTTAPAGMRFTGLYAELARRLAS